MEIKLNLFWVNGPVDNKRAFEMIVPSTAKISHFRKEFLRIILDEVKIPLDTSIALDDQIRLMFEDGYLLTSAEDYMTIRDFNPLNIIPLNLIFQTRRCGLVNIPIKSLETKTETYYQFDLLKDSVRTLRARVAIEERIPINTLLICFGDKDRAKLSWNQNSLRKVILRNTNKGGVHSYLNKAFQLTVKDSVGGNLVLDVVPGHTTRLLKFMIQELKGISIRSQRLTYLGYELEDGKKLCCYGITGASTTLNLSVRLGDALTSGVVQQNSMSRRKSSDSSDNGETHSVPGPPNEFSNIIPAWQITKPGLNMEGICGNPECEAFEKLVMAPMGFGNFHVKHDLGKVKCPICKASLASVLTCGYKSTFCRCYGRKQNDSELYDTDWRIMGKIYTPAPLNTIGNWLRGLEAWDVLIIQTKPMFINEVTSGQHLTPSHCGFCFNEITSRVDERGTYVVACTHIYHSKCYVREDFVCMLCKGEEEFQQRLTYQ